MSRVAFVLMTALLVAASLGVPGASASRRLQLGMYDPAFVFSNPEKAFPVLEKLRVRVLRVPIEWGKIVAVDQPKNGADPADPAYNWTALDHVVTLAAKSKIKVLFSIYGTPRWASGSSFLNRPPKNPTHLQKFAFAAAKRYSGTFENDDGEKLPAVRMWLAWNEPNNPVYLSKQWKRVGKRWVVQSARDYAVICTAIYNGVHQTRLSGEQVACGGTAPRGNNAPRTSRPSVAPITFLRALKNSRLKRFDVYAHHPYATSARETPTTKPKKNVVSLANIGDLIKELTRLYGNKRLWITEYGYQTNPPDRLFGVTWKRQALFLRQAWTIARRNPRIDMLLWFLVKDEDRLGGWQSGFFTVGGKRKPAYDTFRRLPH